MNISPKNKKTRAKMFNPKDFFQGFQAFFKGWKLLYQNRSLWKYAVLPGILNAVVFIGVVILVIVFASEVFGLIWSWLGVEPDESTFFLLRWLAGLGQILLGIALVIVGYNTVFIVYSIISGIVCGPFNAVLANKVYINMTGSEIPDTPHNDFVQIFRDIWYELVYLCYYIGVSLFILLPLNLIPVAGTVWYAVRSHYFTFTMLGWDHVTRPLDRMGTVFSQRRVFVRSHRPACAGLGTAVFLMLLVPILNLLVMPGAVVSGIVLYRELEQSSNPDEKAFFPNAGQAG